MNKKAMTYFLIAIVAIVWGNIFYRLFFYMNSGKEIISDSDFIAPALPQNSNDTFNILANYRDPFLIPIVMKQNTGIGTKRKIPVVKAPPMPTIWPGISYNGMIKNQQSDKQLGIVVVNGQSNIMRSGDTYMDVTIGKLYKDSVEISYKNIKKTIHK